MQGEWPSLIRQCGPEVLLLVGSLAGQSDQRYAGDDRWYHLGDGRYTAVHDGTISQLLAEEHAYGTEVLFANSSYSPSCARERVDDWNALLATWAGRWSDVSVVDIAGPIADAEAAAGHSLRPDALHLDDATLQMIVQTVYVPVIEAAVDR